MASSSKTDELQSRFELKTLLETSRMLIESRETDFVLNNLLLITMGKLLIPRGCILIFEPESGRYTVSRIKGKANVREEDTLELPWQRTGNGQNIIDPAKEDTKAPELFQNQEGGLYFNLQTSTHHLGYLYLGNKGNGNPLSRHEVEFVESLSIISSVAIANSQMFTELRGINRKLDRRVYELNTLFGLSKDFSVMVDREKIASTFKFALLGQLLIRKFFLICEFDENLELMGANGLKRNPKKEEQQKIFQLADGVIYESPEYFSEISFLRENEITALISLELQGEKTAVVGVGERANREPYTESDFNFLQSLGNLALLSIQKTFFFEERIEKERLEEELNIAKTIQQRLLPDPIPEIPTLDLAARNVSSRQVGGDYFDVVQTPDSNFILAIGDVTGKGVPAALLMANLQSMLHILLPVDISLSEATGRINNLIFENTPSDKFITFFWGKYFQKEKRLRYVNAGHNPPLVLRHDSKQLEELNEGGLILGAMSSMSPYEETDVYLNSGDLVICFTDGVTETFNEKNQEYGDERLHKTIIKHRNLSAEALQQKIIDDILDFSNENLSDDMTLIVFKVD
ncbi:MAG: SpoIIE family protein phosphatase [Balneolaceae bacterium]